MKTQPYDARTIAAATAIVTAQRRETYTISGRATNRAIGRALRALLNLPAKGAR